MRILVVGSGGREHALVWRLAQEATVLATPGNPGIAELVPTFDVSATDLDGLLQLIRREAVDLVVFGPEEPLVRGLADQLRAEGVAVFGPGAEAAQLEGSKAFAKDIMAEAQIPTATFRTFTDPVEAKEYARLRFTDGYPVVVKASGNALGKGVVVAEDVAEAEYAIDRMMIHRDFGSAGATVVLEDRLDGPEFSLLTICGDHNFVSLPVAQDYKRIGTGDTGLNTGGMGTYAPVDGISPELVADVEEHAVARVLHALRERGLGYRGVLFTGVMMHHGHPHVLEFNVRFGDPETQSVMAILGSGLAAALHQAARGDVITPPHVTTQHAVSVVAASFGYPGEIERGIPITLGPLPSGAILFHAGTALQNGQLVTNGGRVLAVTGTGDSLEAARATAYDGMKQVSFRGMHVRTDIASA